MTNLVVTKPVEQIFTASIRTKLLCLIGVVIALLSNTYAQAPTHAKIQTSMGDIIIELSPNEAPTSVTNFMEYATSGYYDRLLIHRVVKDFVIQGGGFSTLFTRRALRDPIPYEGENGLKNLRGTIAMARNDDQNSAQAQWFINLRNNKKLDHRVTDLGPIYGYAVFGHVVEGMDVADAIGDVETGSGGPFDEEVPVERILINRIDPVEWPLAD
ncbi:MAG: peptidyl-prolyl cis-trans isomerase [Alphaproteobacteria bacterium]|nr:peptidyl-prolyl cis-trans isomerase [Alphaproteobacteria bacterium]